jgi:hypothetical protein
LIPVSLHTTAAGLISKIKEKHARDNQSFTHIKNYVTVTRGTNSGAGTARRIQKIRRMDYDSNLFCRLVTEFVDSILRETASKAVAREPPLSLREMRERWADLVEKKNAFQLWSGGRFDNGGGKQDGNRQATRSGSVAGAAAGRPAAGRRRRAGEPNTRDTMSVIILTGPPDASGQ